MPSFAESEYNIEDRLPVVEPFDEHESMALRGGFEEHRDTIRGDTSKLPEDVLNAVEDRELERIENPDEEHELELFYQVTETSGEVSTWCSPSARAEGNMLEGVLTYPSSVTGCPLQKYRKQS